MTLTRRNLLGAGIATIVVLAVATSDTWRSILSSLRSRLAGRATVQDRLAAYGEDARSRLRPAFEKAGVVYPPGAVTLVGLKREKQLQLYAADPGMSPRFIRSYDVLAASGKAGPKLAEGDLQVPEGIYRIESLNPNSNYHLSLRIDYPNEFDRARAREEGRTQLGGDIMIHGSNVSIGCIAIGDEAIEEVFVLAADIGAHKIEVILSPADLRIGSVSSAAQPVRPWLPGLYETIRAALARLPLPRPEA